MKIFQSTQRTFKILGFVWSKAFNKITINVRNVIILIGHLVSLAFPSIYFMWYADNFRERSDGFFAIASEIANFADVVVIIWKIPKIFKLIDDIEAVIAKRMMNPTSNDIYEKANQKIEKLTEIIYFAGVQASPLCIISPYLMMSYFFYFTTNAGKEAFLLPFPFWFAWEWRDPYLYPVSAVVELIFGFCAVITAVCVLCYFVATCFMFIAFAEDIKQEISTLNGIGKIDGSLAQLKAKISKIVQLHSIAKQRAHDFTDIYEFILAFYFLWSVSTICSNLLSIQMGLLQNGTTDLFVLISQMSLMLWSLVQIFIFCQLGENVTGAFEDIDHTIYYHLNWNNFPLEIQRILPTLLVNSQQEVVVKGFGNMLCTRETFKKVVNIAYSYFSVLRNFQN